MAGTITHEWNGTTLIITSDSGTSSCDLKGDKGDMGIRGAQGIQGCGYYPVGALYISTVETSPAAVVGGTWERIKDRFILAAGDTYKAGATGGSASHTHTPNLWADIYPIGTGTEHRGSGIFMMKTTEHEGMRTMDYFIQDNGSLTRTTITSTVGYKRGTAVGGTISSSSNLPPYLSVYVWKRVA